MNRFRQLALLNRAHGRVFCGLAGLFVFILVILASGRLALAKHAANLWITDQFTKGAHVLRWHLAYGWTGRAVSRTPEFDVSALMDKRTRTIVTNQLRKRVVRNANALWGRRRQRDQFALLNFLARDFHETGEVTEYQKVASLMLSELCVNPAPAIESPKTSKFSRDQGRETLVAVGAILDRISTPWYIVSGTFLGAVREGNFLSHDYDIDIGINNEDLDICQLLEAIEADPELTLVNENHYIHRVSPLCDDIRPALFRVMHRSMIEVDIFIHYLDAKQRWHGSQTHCWTNHDFTLTNYTIAGISVRGPADADRYLLENYGEWRTPVTVFNCSTGTPNVSFNHNLFSVSRLIHSAVKATQSYTSVDAEVSRLVLIQEGYLIRKKCHWQFAIGWI